MTTASTGTPRSSSAAVVNLRRHRERNLPHVTRWYRDPELARLTRYQTRPMTIEEIERFFQSRLLSDEAIAYAIHEAATDRLIGLTTFSALDADNGSVLFHITIGEHDAWGQGYGTEATELMLWHAFERLGLHRVGLSVFAFNERAIRATRRPASGSRAGCARRSPATAAAGTRSRWASCARSGSAARARAGASRRGRAADAASSSRVGQTA